MRTSIQVSDRLKRRLAGKKRHPRETYEEVIQRALDASEEDDLEVSASFRKKAAAGRRDIAAGRHLTTEELIRDLGL